MKSIRETFGDTLVEVGRKNKNILAMTCDLKSACKLKSFFEHFPERSFEIGIAEGNGVGIASGLALAGFRPFIASFASFIAGKNLEIRTSISYNNAPVVVVGTHGGLIGPDGATQSGIQDIAVMRTLPDFEVYQPCSNIETREIVKYLSKRKVPAYLRISRNTVPETLPTNYKFKPGKGHILRQGKDIAIISSGPLVYNCLEAAELLKNKIKISVINLSSLKPTDTNLVTQIAKKFKAIITVEDHQIEGGLGSIICEIASENKVSCPIFKHGLSNSFIESDSPAILEKNYGLDTYGIIKFITKKYKLI